MKKTVLTVVQIVVTVAILAWVFHDKQKRDSMWQALLSARQGWPWIIAAITAYGVLEILAVWRWHLLLGVQGIFLGPLRLASLLMIGVFFNAFTPGATGGDVVKIFFLLKETPGKKGAALLAVLMDRVIGLLALIVIAGLIIGWRYEWLTQTEVTRNLTWGLLVIMGASLGGIMFSFLITATGLVNKLPARLPFRETLVELSIAYNLYARAWKPSLGAFVVSLGVHFAVFYMFYFAARSLHAAPPVKDFFSVMPIINTISALPFSVGGTGPREWMFQELLGKLSGIDPGVAVAISLLGFCVLVFWALVGGVIYAFYRPSEHQPLSTIIAEVEALEHKIAARE